MQTPKTIALDAWARVLWSRVDSLGVEGGVDAPLGPDGMGQVLRAFQLQCGHPDSGPPALPSVFVVAGLQCAGAGKRLTEVLDALDALPFANEVVVVLSTHLDVEAWNQPALEAVDAELNTVDGWRRARAEEGRGASMRRFFVVSGASAAGFYTAWDLDRLVARFLALSLCDPRITRPSDTEEVGSEPCYATFGLAVGAAEPPPAERVELLAPVEAWSADLNVVQLTNRPEGEDKTGLVLRTPDLWPAIRGRIVYGFPVAALQSTESSPSPASSPTNGAARAARA